jgi:PAS domain S-box-containing protein
LYLRNRVRVLADVQAEPVPLVPRLHPDTGAEVDLSLALLRAFSPIHREYLSNMGVRATLVASIVRDGQLWGLIACHQRTPRVPPPAVRTLLAAVADLIAVQSELFEQHERTRGVALGQELLAQMPRALEQASDWMSGLAAPETRLRAALQADGFVALDGARQVREGRTPTAQQVQRIVAWLERGERTLVVTERLAQLAPELADLTPQAAGVIALRVPHTEAGWMLWFRQVLPLTVRWAGDPRKGLTTPANGPTRLAPRTSFAAWLQEVHDQARPWTLAEQALVAETVRTNLLDVLAGVQRRTANALRPYRDVVLEQVNDAVVMLDLQDRIMFWNAGATRILGWTSAEMVGRPALDRYPPDLRERGRAALDQIRAGQSFAGEWPEVRKDGQKIWVTAHSQLLRDAAGRPMGTIGISRDITAQKLAEAELRLMQAVVTHARDAILVTEAEPIDLPGPRIVYANPAFFALTGYSADEVIGNTPRMLHGPDTQRATLDRVRQALCHWHRACCTVPTPSGRRSIAFGRRCAIGNRFKWNY